jgi:putative hydrolase of the HAD superfamily
MFERALAQFGVAPEEALHVGDSVAEDVQGARAAAIRVLLLAREGRPAPPGVATIASLADL